MYNIQRSVMSHRTVEFYISIYESVKTMTTTRDQVGKCILTGVYVEYLFGDLIEGVIYRLLSNPPDTPNIFRAGYGWAHTAAAPGVG